MTAAYILGSGHNDLARPAESDLPLMPKGSLGTVQEGNSLVQDEVEIKNTLTVLFRSTLAQVLPHVLDLALVVRSEALAQAGEEFPARAMVSEAPSCNNVRRQQEQEQKECGARHGGLRIPMVFCPWDLANSWHAVEGHM